MFRINNNSVINSYNYGRTDSIDINTDESISVGRTILNTDLNSTAYVPVSHIMRRDIEYVPVMAIDVSSEAVDEDTIFARLLSGINSAMGNKTVDVSDIISETSKVIAERYMENVSNSYARTFICEMSVGGTINSTQLREALFNFRLRSLTNIRAGRARTGTSNERRLVSFMYYCSRSKIFFTMVVKRTRVKEFKRNYVKGYIDPKDVEIWVDKEFYEDKRAYGKVLNNSILPYLVFRGFNILVKDDILSEFVYTPKFRPKSISDLTRARERVNDLILSGNNILKVFG